MLFRTFLSLLPNRADTDRYAAVYLIDEENQTKTYTIAKVTEDSDEGSVCIWIKEQ